MPDDNKYSDDGKNPKKGGEFRVPPRTYGGVDCHSWAASRC